MSRISLQPEAIPRPARPWFRPFRGQDTGASAADAPWPEEAFALSSTLRSLRFMLDYFFYGEFF